MSEFLDSLEVDGHRLRLSADATVGGTNSGDQDLSAYLTSATAASTYVTGASLTDNAIVRGDGGAGGVQTSSATIADNGRLTVSVEDALSTSAVTGLVVDHNISGGGGGDSIGTGIALRAETTTTASEAIVSITATWTVATHASRTGQLDFHVYDSTGGRQVLRLEASGTAAEIGFLGAAAAAQQTGDAGTAMVTFGLMSGTPTFAAANVTGTVAAATLASTVTVADAGADTTTWVLLGTSQTGSLSPATDAGLTYNASANALTTTTFIGALTGNASTATTLQTARAIGGVNFDGSAAIVPQTIESANEASDTTCFLLFITASGTQSLQPKNNTGLTFNSSTGLLGAAALPAFVAAGGSAAKGAAPAPGATTHSNRPFYLGDDGAWHARTGELIAASFVTTSESTTSTSAVDLTTTQHLTFTLDETSDLFIQVSSTHSNSGANVNRLVVDVDGSDTILSATAVTAASTNNVMAHSMTSTGLASGSHTIKLQFSTSAGTASFFNRTITVWRLA